MPGSFPCIKPQSTFAIDSAATSRGFGAGESIQPPHAGTKASVSSSHQVEERRGHRYFLRLKLTINYLDQGDVNYRDHSQKMRRSFTTCFAEMGLASRYSEAMACDTKSDEQRDARHGDYLDIQVMRRKAGLDYFSLMNVSKLKHRARTLVKQYAAAKTAVAERLLMCETLDRAEVENIIKRNPVSAKV
jgi:hypothetical protein